MTIGRQHRGEQVHCSKLTAYSVRRMRRLARGGMPLMVIARRYPHVSKVAVWKVIHRKSWRHIPEEL